MKQDTSQKIEKYRNFLNQYFAVLLDEGASGGGLTFPIFELYSRDYLGFAQRALERGGTDGLINCVSNLKRAMDCELDTFLYLINAKNIFEKKNLGVEKKLHFIEKCGIYNSKSLSKLNSIRNKMEHHYEVPKVEEIEIYFDLVVGLMGALQMTSTLLLFQTEQNLMLDEMEVTTHFNSECYIKELNPYIEVCWDLKGEAEQIRVYIEEYEAFTYFLKIHLLLLQRHSIMSSQYISTVINNF